MENSEDLTFAWTKPSASESKLAYLTPSTMRILSKFAAKRGLMSITPSLVIEKILLEYRVEETM